MPANAMSEATMNILLTDFMASGYFDEIFAYSVVSKGCGNADGIAGHAYFYLFVPVEVVSFFILWLKSRPCEKFLSDLCTSELACHRGVFSTGATGALAHLQFFKIGY